MAEKKFIGQYEYEHKSGLGLDYFTSRLDRLVLNPNGSFTLIVQDRSRLTHAATSFVKGKETNQEAPETRMEGNYSVEGQELALNFDSGGFEAGKLSWDGKGIQLGPNFFRKVSDSSFLPSTERLQKNMSDIQKGLKIAGTIGGFAAKAVKGIQQVIQPAEEEKASSRPPTPQPRTQVPSTNSRELISFCEHCGNHISPGRKFCGKCGQPVR